MKADPWFRPMANVRAARGLPSAVVLLAVLLCWGCSRPDRATNCAAVAVSTPERDFIPVADCAGAVVSPTPVIHLTAGEEAQIRWSSTGNAIEGVQFRSDRPGVVRVDGPTLTAASVGTAQLLVPRSLVACLQVRCVVATIVVDAASVSGY